MGRLISRQRPEDISALIGGQQIQQRRQPIRRRGEDEGSLGRGVYLVKHFRRFGGVQRVEDSQILLVSKKEHGIGEIGWVLVFDDRPHPSRIVRHQLGAQSLRKALHVRLSHQQFAAIRKVGANRMRHRMVPLSLAPATSFPLTQKRFTARTELTEVDAVAADPTPGSRALRPLSPGVDADTAPAIGPAVAGRCRAREQRDDEC